MSISENTGSSGEATQVEARPEPRSATASTGVAKRRKFVDETELFAAGSDPQYFGTGSYAMGGSNQEGNYGLGDPDPRGGYGDFTDAGGYGSTTLYGEQSEAAADASERKDTAPSPAESSAAAAGTEKAR